MTNTSIKITGAVIGDSFAIERVPYSGLPLGVTVTKAYLTLKSSKSQLDAAAIGQLSITTSAGNAGQILKAATTGTASVTKLDGTAVSCGDGTIALRFVLSEAITTLATARTYYFDVQIETNETAGYNTHTLEVGEIVFIKGMTDAAS